MKKCPSCYQLFGDENDFCLSDGSPLVSESGSFRQSGDMPTQFIPRAQPTVASTGGGTSPILYAVIGILATALVGVCVYLIFLRDTPKNSNITAANSTPAASTPAEQPTPASTAPTANNAMNSPAKPASPPIDPSLTPAGNWSGEWSHKKRTSAFTARMELQQSDGRVDGRIVWTLTYSSNPEKIDKSGLTAIEYVRGTFDPITRLVKIRGYRKDDPNNLVIYDNYNLSLSADNRSMSGTSRNGSFQLRR